MFSLRKSGNRLHWQTDQTDGFWLAVLLIAALIVFLINLGEVALRDWDEGTVAQVARSIYQAPPGSLTWLHPTLGGEPYLNKPPLMHWLIAIAYQVGGVNEWTSRLPGALLTAVSVPLLYSIGREACHRRTVALFAALVYLTSLPVVRHGRLAMLDGAVLCFMLLMIWCMLRSRRDLHYTLGVGIGLGLLCLTKGVMIGVLVGAIAVIFLMWDTPRLLTTPYLWLGVMLGCAPVALWYGAQWLHYGQPFVDHNLADQSFRRVWTSVEDNDGPPWYYLLELLKYGFPWVLFLPLGLRHTWENRNLSWAKLVLVWSGVYLVAISLMFTKLPWYSLPLYPALALITGAQLTALWDQGRQGGVKQTFMPYDYNWIGLFMFFTGVSGAGYLYLGWFAPDPDPDLALILAAVALTMAVATVLLAQQNAQFITVLAWGMYVALVLLMQSHHWNWELAEAYPVKPVAHLVQQATPADKPIYTSFPHQRPSLDFYSDRRVIPASLQQLKRYWRRDRPAYFLLDTPTLDALPPDSRQILGTAEGWTLVTQTRP